MPDAKQSTNSGRTEKHSEPDAYDAFDVHRQMVIALFLATFALVVVLSLGLLASRVTILMVTAAAGALGGFVSALRRLYTFQRIFPVDFFSRWHRVDLYLIIYSMIPSLVGCIAGVTLYVLFASELIQGKLFPAFHLATADPKKDAFQNFLWNWEPDMSADYAKAIVWSFIAGFSERFVPNLLDQFASEQQHKPDDTASQVSSAEKPLDSISEKSAEAEGKPVDVRS